MATRSKYWTIITLLLLGVIIAGALLLWTKYPRAQPIEISLSPRPEIRGAVYVGGPVHNPGIYPLAASDTVHSLIQAAGGTTAEAAAAQMELYVPTSTKDEEPQKVNLNRAQSWLLQALPGVGEARAQAIIDYREQHGGFSHTGELMNVEGIGVSTYEQVKHLVTVAE